LYVSLLIIFQQGRIDMADRKRHVVLGAAVGLSGYALYLWVRGEKISLPELIGASLSGVAGALLPDVLEPATNPNHRSFFHSVSFASAAGLSVWSWAWRIRDEQVRFAEECEWRANAVCDEHEKNGWRWKALWHRFLAGLIPGLILGYASHLAADAVTPKSLPLL
jgi:membrane-bound metal-dependent hydrolase YbcI (DUF457 family)